jgi:hypothetical protein
MHESIYKLNGHAATNGFAPDHPSAPADNAIRGVHETDITININDIVGEGAD